MNMTRNPNLSLMESIITHFTNSFEFIIIV